MRKTERSQSVARFRCIGRGHGECASSRELFGRVGVVVVGAIMRSAKTTDAGIAVDSLLHGGCAAAYRRQRPKTAGQRSPSSGRVSEDRASHSGTGGLSPGLLKADSGTRTGVGGGIVTLSTPAPLRAQWAA